MTMHPILQVILKHLGWQNFGCYAHLLNLIVLIALSSPEINELNVKIKLLLFLIQRSSTAVEKMVSYQTNSGIKVALKLTQEVHTSSNSTFYMLKICYDHLQDAV